jgi:hypothetical protein
MFSILLAVLGAIVSILEFSGWKRWVMVLLFVLLGVGEYVSIRKADDAHAKEINDQKQAVETLRNIVQVNEIRNAGDMGYLKAKLEDSEKSNDRLSKFAPAIMKLAETSEEFTRKQYEVKVTSDKELYEFTMGVVKKIRDFSTKYQTLQRQQIDEAINASRTSNLSDAERHQRWNEETQKSIQLSYARDNEFRTSLLPDATYARQELLKRTLPEPVLPREQKYDVDMVFRGMLAGIYPELALANYLELMVKPLSRK